MIENFSELKEEALKSDLISCILQNQAEQTGYLITEILDKVNIIADCMFDSLQNGLKNADIKSKSTLSGDNLSHLSDYKHKFISPFVHKAMRYSFAIIEENARMGKIAACPTAGSSGIVPAVLISAYEEFSLSKADFINSLIVAGEIGRIISIKVPPSGAIAGCQAECGVASCMAASGLAYLFKQNIDTILNAGALSLKNVLGLACDPVSGLVEVPCVKRNPLMVSHAISSCYLAMNGIESKIPLDDIVDAMREIGNLLSPKLKESSEAGLAATKAAININNSLNKLWHA